MVAYIDYGISPGMRAAMEAAEKLSLPIERRQLPRFKEFPQPRKKRAAEGTDLFGITAY